MKKFEDELDGLVDSAGSMCDMCQSLFERATVSLRTEDIVLAGEVVMDYDRILSCNSSIEEESIRILSLYQPMAVDLRVITSILKAVSNLERIGKNSKNVAKMTIALHDMQHIDIIPEIWSMCTIAEDMLRISINGFKGKSIEGFERLRKLDDEMDSLRDSALVKCMSSISDDSINAKTYLEFISLSRFLEKIGDHACKIAEKVTYMVTGEHTDIDL